MNKESDPRYQLWKNCFHDSDQYLSYYWDNKMKENRVLELWADKETKIPAADGQGMLASMLHLNPYLVRAGEQTAVTEYIVGVATDPSMRHRGFMAALLKQAMDEMYAAGQTWTYLMPASEAITVASIFPI